MAHPGGTGDETCTEHVQWLVGQQRLPEQFDGHAFGAEHSPEPFHAALCGFFRLAGLRFDTEALQALEDFIEGGLVA
ncbi:hypothetical protein D3C85_1505830 [compost metagenome]